MFDFAAENAWATVSASQCGSRGTTAIDAATVLSCGIDWDVATRGFCIAHLRLPPNHRPLGNAVMLVLRAAIRNTIFFIETINDRYSGNRAI
jgi:hypothetical protein